MPKYLPKTAKLKRKKLIKTYIEAGLNQSELARRRGVSQSAINQQVTKPEVQDTLREYLNSDGLKRELIKVAKEGLKANKVISAMSGKDANGKTCDFIDVPDHTSRHKFWHDLLTTAGVLKPGETSISQTVVIADLTKYIKEKVNAQRRTDVQED